MQHTSQPRRLKGLHVRDTAKPTTELLEPGAVCYGSAFVPEPRMLPCPGRAAVRGMVTARSVERVKGASARGARRATPPSRLFPAPRRAPSAALPRSAARGSRLGHAKPEDGGRCPARGWHCSCLNPASVVTLF